MKTYKLLKTYPSLPRDWKIGMEVGLGDRNWGYSPCSVNYTDCRKLENPEVENSPEFWKELIEDFEILSFKRSDTGDISSKRSNGLFINSTEDIEGEYTEKSHDGFWEIYSVKRLSDNVVFTIGDRVVRHADESCQNPCLAVRTIEGFHYNKSKNLCFKEAEQEGYMLKLFSKVKEPLLVTEDGVELFQGDTFYISQRDNKGYSGRFLEFKAHIGNTIRPHGKIFANKEKAREWVEFNKKQYSLNEIEQAFNAVLSVDVEIYKGWRLELIKDFIAYLKK